MNIELNESFYQEKEINIENKNDNKSKIVPFKIPYSKNNINQNNIINNNNAINNNPNINLNPNTKTSLFEINNINENNSPQNYINITLNQTKEENNVHNKINFETEKHENIKSKMVGYSFKYNGKYISVYGELPLNENCDIENLKQILQVIINSVKVYNGESLQELGGNAIEFYDGGFSNNDIAINYYSAHNLNGVLAPYYKKVVIELSASKFDYYKDWDKTLDGIIKVADKLKSYDSYFGYSEKTKLKEDEITINKIKMKHYVFKIMYGTNYGAYVSTYTFIVNDTPFILAYGLSDKIDMTSKKKKKTQKIIEQTEIVTRSFVDTIRFLNGDSFTKYVKVN